MTEQLTREQAIAFVDSDAWKAWDPPTLARFQLEQERLCVPWGAFHKAVGDALGRPVWTHEFVDKAKLLAELDGAPSPSMGDILDMLPADKTIVVTA